jgi:rhodanese-related sulfurtransferase
MKDKVGEYVGGNRTRKELPDSFHRDAALRQVRQLLILKEEIDPGEPCMKNSPALSRKSLTVIAIVWCLVVNTPCDAGQSPLIKPAEAFALIQKNRGNPQFVILDVRTPEEFKTGHIEGAINIDFNSNGFRDEIGKLDRQEAYLVYCRTGRRSKEAVQIMRDLGFTKLLRFDGDIVLWQVEKLPIVK